MKKSIELHVQAISEDEVRVNNIKEMIRQVSSGTFEKELLREAKKIKELGNNPCPTEVAPTLKKFTDTAVFLMGLHKATEKELYDLMNHFRYGVEYYEDKCNKMKDRLEEALRDLGAMRYAQSSYTTQAMQKHSTKNFTNNTTLRIVR